jgi:hypothetical protein
MITNHSQLKKQLVTGVEFDIVEHCRPEVIGERRRVNYADSTGIYTIKSTDLDGVLSKANGGKGSYLRWEKALFWEFRDDGVCALYSSASDKTPENLIIALRLIEGG